MNSKTHPPADLLGLPFFWQEGVLSQVHLGENVLAWLEVDLNDELRFKKNLVILTDQRSSRPTRPKKVGIFTLSAQI